MVDLDLFLRDLFIQGVVLWIENGRLQIDAPQEALSPEILALLKQYESEIITTLPSYTFEIPLSYNQEALWFIQQNNPDTIVYNTAVSLHLQSKVDIELLVQICQTLVQRHSALRTTFATTDLGQPKQVVHATQQVHFTKVDCADQSWETLMQLVEQTYQQPYNLEHGPLFRVTLFTQSPTSQVLLFGFHHIISDAGSQWVLLDELLALYENNDHPFTASILPPVEGTYAQFVQWHRTLLEEKADRLQTYWQKTLKEVSPVLNLATDYPLNTDHPHTTTQPKPEQSIPLNLGTTLTEQLKTFAATEKSTLFTVLLTGYQLLLHRYTGQEDVLVGTPMMQPEWQHFERTFGYRVNPVVLRSSLPDHTAPAVKTYLKQIGTQLWRGLRNRHYPFSWLVKDLQLTSDSHQAPLCQAYFVLHQPQNLEQKTIDLLKGQSVQAGSLTLSLIGLHIVGGDLDITLELMEQGDELVGYVKYNPNLFQESTIKRFRNHYQQLLRALVANPNQSVTTLPILTDAEQQQILVDWNDTIVDYPADKTIHQLFEAQVTRTPDNIAVLFEDQQLTYDQLNQQANQLARHLQSLGVGPEVLVGICMERSLEMIVGLLGILKVGGAYVPLDPTYPAERLAFMLTDANLPILITQSQLWDGLLESVLKVAQRDTKVVCLDHDRETIARLSWANLDVPVKSDNLAYLIYTSGSTGQPKGVLIEQGGLAHHIQGIVNRYRVDTNDCILQFASMSFDTAQEQIFSTLTMGASLCLRDNQLWSIETFNQKVLEHGLTVVDLPPNYFHQLVASWQTIPPAFLNGQLRLILVGGEKIEPATVRLWNTLANGSTQLLNAYGPTETTITTTLFDLTDYQVNDLAQALPIGKALANRKVYILDQNLQPAPIGVPGELHIGGIGVAKGYLNRPELTTVKFISNPFASNADNGNNGDERLYKTGDLVRWLPDGNIEFIGRVDHQVKIRGFRIELGEIETVLGQHPHVQDVVVMAQGQTVETDEQKRLVAYLIPNSKHPLQSEGSEKILKLRSYLKEKLPDYMIPNAFVVLEQFPLTPNGKVDRKALPEPDMSDRVTEQAFVLPQTPTEALLAGVWAEVLGIEKIGRYDNFFELGGHSLLATQVVSRLGKLFENEVGLRTVFETPILFTLAQTIDTLHQNENQLPTPPPIQTIDRTQTLPLSFAQQRLWFIDQFEGPSPTYNIPLTLRLTGLLNLSALETALNEIVQRHEVLRTTFPAINGVAHQQIVSKLALPLQIIDLQNGPTTNLEEQLSQDAWQPFDLTTGPLFRVTLYRLGAMEQVLLLTMHHIISDGWSIGLLLEELSVLYQAFTMSQPPALPVLSIQYADFAVWQRNWLQGAVLEKQLQYWQKQLADAPILLDLPTDHPRPAQQTFKGQMIFFEVEVALLNQLQALSRNEGVSLFMTLYGAFSVLLARYTGQTDLVIGSPIANRHHQAIEPLIGFFVNTLALRVNLSGNPTFAELLTQIRHITLEAYHHQDIPFEQLVNELNIPRNLSHSPLFQVMLALDNNQAMLTQLGDLQITPMWPNSQIAKFDLTLFLTETETGLQGGLEYNTDLFKPETIVRLIGHFKVLLTGIVANPNQPITKLPLLTKAERHQILVDWNDTSTAYPVDKTIHHLFEEQVKRTPDNIAVVFEEQQLTYDALNQRANQLAHYLQSLGVGPEMLVGICVERSLDMVVGLLGILKAGGAYVPLDPTYPTERLAFMLTDTDVSIVVTQTHLQDRLPKTVATVIDLDHDWAKIETYSKENLKVTVKPNNLAYVMFTSGSTGQPKGITIPHVGIVRLVCNTNYIHLSRTDVIAQVSNIAFDAATFEIWGALTQGGCLVGFSKEVALSPSRLAKQLREKNISVLFLTTALFNQIAYQQPNAFETVQSVLFGGEAVDPQAVQTILAHNAPKNLLHVYGPTENTTFSTWHLVDAVATDAATVPIGKAIANTQLYIVDQQIEPVPIGVTGELLIGGAGLAKGYLNRPELTTEKFIPNLFSVNGNDSEDRLYKTGDLVRWLPDGNIEFMGRIDHQVKIRGFRIELGEIEALLGQYSQVQEVVVIARSQQLAGGEQKQLVAYLIPNSKQNFHEAEQSLVPKLRAYLKEKLPDYMIPQTFVVLEQFPLTPNGKIDRKALPEPDVEDRVTAHTFAPPQTPTEERLASVWGEVLGLKQVGRHDNFFELGGHSLLATQVVSRLQSLFEIEIGVRTVFETPTLLTLAQTIDTLHQHKHQHPVPPPIQAIDRTQSLPLSFAQQRLWFIDQFEGPSPTYNMPMPFQLQGSLNLSVLEAALNEVVARHEVLRTTFPMRDGVARQDIKPTLRLPLTVVDLQHLSGSEQEQGLTEQLNQEAWQPFNLATGPLLRVTLYQLGSSEQVLLLNMHHIISDGWSVGVLLQELSSLYDAFNQGHPSPLPALAIQYADFTVWQRNWLQGEVLEIQLTYWREQLANAPALLELPTDYPRSAIQRFNGAVETATFSPELVASLNALAQLQGVSLPMVLQAAWAILLFRYSHQQEIVIGMSSANRYHPDIEPLIGLFINLLPLYFEITDNPTTIQFLQQVKQVMLDANTHQQVPFERLVDELQVERQLSYPPIVQVVFNFLPNSNGALNLAFTSLNATQVELEYHLSKFDLTLNVLPNEAHGLDIGLEYSTDLFKPARIKRMLGHLEGLLKGMVATPDQSISGLPMLTEAERHQILVDWNDTGTDYPANKTIHSLFEEQVEQTPDNIAVVFETDHLTYHNLNQRANQLAYYLQSLGIGPEVLVGICVERSVEMVIGLLGILKAGGAYLPLDPNYPAERLAFMMTDADVSILLTQSHLQERLPTTTASIIYLDKDWNKMKGLPKDNLKLEVRSDNLAYVIYTSGSTGKPKGVLVNHQGMTNLIDWHQTQFDITPKDRATQLASLSFDAAGWEIWPYLTNGSVLFLVPSAVLFSPHLLQNWLIEQQITITFIPTPLTESLIGLKWPKNCSLRLLLTGGDKLNIAPSEKTPFVLINNYGPTENSVVTTSGQVMSDLIIPSIGKPITNTQLYIVDHQLEPVPIGVTGELLIGGAGLARGYLNRPELTAEKFILNPFSINGDGSEGRLYKTGDLVRWLPDGNIEFMGRIDHQVKIRGFRIELGEVEALLGQYSQVQEVVVIALSQQLAGGEQKQLVAYLIPNSKESFHEAEQSLVPKLRAYLKEKLPDYMIPQAFVVLEQFPLTPNGKIDRKALPEPDMEDMVTTHTFAPPQTPTEERLAGVWSEVLGLKQVGRYDNFFELGGHSLLATQVVSRLQNSFEVEIGVRTVFETPTLLTLAQTIDTLHQHKHQHPVPPPIQVIDRTQSLPLSFAQQRLWFIDQFEGPSPTYNMPMLFQLQGPLNLSVLEMALNEVVARHEVLRTTFPMRDGVARQDIKPTLRLPLTVVDLQHLSGSEQEQALTEQLNQEAWQPFNLATGPLLRVTLYQLGSSEQVLLLNMHHIIGDGWSVGVLLQELSSLYDAFNQGHPSPLPALAIQYADFTVWQRNWLQGEVLEIQLTYWRGQLANAPALLELPTDYPRPAIQRFNGAIEITTFTQEFMISLNTFAQLQGVSLPMVLQAAWVILLFRYSHQKEIVIGMGSANRYHPDIEPLIGFFVNMLPLYFEITGNPTTIAFLQQVKQVMLDANTHQQVPFERLVDELQVERQLSYPPIVQVAFNFLPTLNRDLNLSFASLNATQVELEYHLSKFDLTLNLLPNETHGMDIWLEYSTDLFKPSRIKRMLGHLERLLIGMVTNPNCSITELPILTEAEQHQILVEWNDTTTDYPTDKTIHQLFEEQVKQTPDNIAVILDDEQLTYADLNQQANQLAYHLQDMGVGPEVLVGICVERSLEMIAGLLGILKAGGAYVPLDPTYPTNRLAFMMTDAHVSVVLTQTHLQDILPETQAKLVYLDQNQPEIEDLPQDNLKVTVKPNQLAYVIYTSGSTGQPKGVLVEHHNVLAMLHGFEKLAPAKQPLNGVSIAPFAFDVSVWDLFSNLCFGHTLHVIPLETIIDLNKLTNYLLIHDINSMYIPPTFLEPLINTLETCQPVLLNRILVGVEPIEQGLLQRYRNLLKRLHIINGYGPTETTICATLFEFMETENPRERTPIGQPIPGYELYVVDHHLHLVPIGVAGELLIGGAGLARGYLNRPELTAEKFIPNPFSANGNKGEGRLYKTGDLARWLPDGNIEFIGRIDHQVKIRGFRIELGEIEALLNSQPTIDQALVTLKERATGDKQLVAYLKSTNQPIDADTEETHLDLWQTMYDQTYTQETIEDLSFNITGWGNSYTGHPIPAEEMREWVTETVARIQSLHPKRVLEIGCGTGLLLARIAPNCNLYVGTDFSEKAIGYTRHLCQQIDTLAHVELHQQLADDFTGFTEAQFDTIILNSVVQYFPHADYLERVIAGALPLLKPNGHIFIGDVRHFDLLEMFHTSVQLYQATMEMTCSQLQTQIRHHQSQERELLLAPEFFLSLAQSYPQITHVQVHPKYSEYDNELTRFRYDTILHVGQNLPLQTSINWLHWSYLKPNLTDLATQLQANNADFIGIQGVPNQRLVAENLALLWFASREASTSVADYQTMLDNQEKNGIALNQLRQLALDNEWQIEVSWLNSDGQGGYDLVFIPPNQPNNLALFAVPPVTTERQRYANIPTQGYNRTQLIAEWRAYLNDKLPDYMIPSVFVVLDQFPLTPNGKIDRKALPELDGTVLATTNGYEPAQTMTEEILVGIWAEVLGLERIGRHDNFFELGGHSLLAVQLMAKLESHLAQTLPVSTLFQAPTIAQFAMLLNQDQSIQPHLSLIPMQTTGTRPPILCLPGAGTQVFYLRQLAQALGATQPFYGLQPPGIEPNTTALDTMAELVTFFQSTLMAGRVKPDYYLGGHSAGGIMAFALALALQSQGHLVPKLLILDALPPCSEAIQETYPLTKPDNQEAFMALMQILKFTLDDGFPISILELEPLNETERWTYLENLASTTNGASQISLKTTYLKRLVTTYQKTIEAIVSYRPEDKYQGELILMIAEESYLTELDWVLDCWQAVCEQPITIHRVPGNHMALLKPPHVAVLAQRLQGYLNNER